mgnify:CR=1 FL=1
MNTLGTSPPKAQIIPYSGNRSHLVIDSQRLTNT